MFVHALSAGAELQMPFAVESAFSLQLFLCLRPMDWQLLELASRQAEVSSPSHLEETVTVSLSNVPCAGQRFLG